MTIVAEGMNLWQELSTKTSQLLKIKIRGQKCKEQASQVKNFKFVNFYGQHGSATQRSKNIYPRGDPCGG